MQTSTARCKVAEFARKAAVASVAAVAAALLVTACGGGAARYADDACTLIKKERKWKRHTRRAEKKWKVPRHVVLAIIHQESRFDANARPKRKRFLGIPTRRPSSAFGYPQALDSTWKLYARATDNFGAERDEVSDAVDFVGWYVATTRRKLNIPADDAYRQYLAYHEGWKGSPGAPGKEKSGSPRWRAKSPDRRSVTGCS